MSALLAVVLLFGTFYVVDPGERGIVVTLGKVSTVQSEGLGFKWPIISSVVRVSIQQQTKKLTADEYTADLQQVLHEVNVLFRVPEGNVVTLYQKYQGDPWEALVEPRVQETMHELSALTTAENIVKQRERIKADALKLIRQKLGDLVVVEDVVIVNEHLSKELEGAIESKMVQQQEAAKAEFYKQKAKVEAETAVLRAEGEAKAIDIRGKAIQANPQVIQLQMVEKWDGKSPLVVGSNANVMLPLERK